MNSTVDILDIHYNILAKFSKQKIKIPTYQNQLDKIEKTIKSNNIRPSLIRTLENERNKLIQTIKDITENISMNFYNSETADLIESYKDILETPIKVSFVGKQLENDETKQNIITEYMGIASKYTDTKLYTKFAPSVISCSNCDNTSDFEIKDNILYICQKCFSQQTIMKHTSSHKDIERVNIGQKYMYDRKVHFRDCINQYQGIFIDEILILLLQISYLLPLAISSLTSYNLIANYNFIPRN